MTANKPSDPVTAELLQIIRLLINRLTPGASPELLQRIEALEQWRAASAAVYPTIATGGQQ